MLDYDANHQGIDLLSQVLITVEIVRVFACHVRFKNAISKKVRVKS
jgi:hypothetical protein